MVMLLRECQKGLTLCAATRPLIPQTSLLGALSRLANIRLAVTASALIAFVSPRQRHHVERGIPPTPSILRDAPLGAYFGRRVALGVGVSRDLPGIRPGLGCSLSQAGGGHPSGPLPIFRRCASPQGCPPRFPAATINGKSFLIHPRESVPPQKLLQNPVYHESNPWHALYYHLSAF